MTPMGHTDQVDDKLLRAIERLGNALKVAKQTIATQVGLSTLQVQIIEQLDRHGKDGIRVGDLAGNLDISSPTVSDSLAALETKGYVRRRPDPADRRATRAVLTSDGRAMAKRIEALTEPIRRVATSWDPTRSANALMLILESIAALHQAGVVTIDRSCLTCGHYDPQDAGPARCLLLELELTPDLHRVDCPEHSSLLAS